MSTTSKVAEQIVSEYEGYCSRSLLIHKITEALQAERERAARIIKEHRESDRCEGSCWELITAAIREGKHRNE